MEFTEIQSRKEEVNVSLFADDILVNISKLINTSSKTAEYKVISKIACPPLINDKWANK